MLLKEFIDILQKLITLKYSSNNENYLREKARAERLESQVKDLKRKLCEEKGCDCGGNCL